MTQLYIWTFFFIFFSIMTYHRIIEDSFLCYTVGPCLSILYRTGCIY